MINEVNRQWRIFVDQWLVNYNQIIMEISPKRAYQLSKLHVPLFPEKAQVSLPLTYEDSLSPVPNYPFCTLGVLTAEADWRTQKGIAFVVEDNYLLTSASNCYSHKHGQFPDVTFTIASNRKHGSDTYKIAKMYIPWQYKNLPANKRVHFDYALLYIQGEPNLKDKYGSLRIAYDRTMENSFTYSCGISDKNELQMVESYSLGSRRLNCSLNGMPRLRWHFTYAEVDALITESSKNVSSVLVKFGVKMRIKLYQWIKQQRDQMVLKNIPITGLDMSWFEGMTPTPIGKLMISQCHALPSQLTRIISLLPFSSVSSLNFRSPKCQIQLGLLRMNLFANMKSLIINDCNLSINGCKELSIIPLTNLRKLVIVSDRPGKKGCEHLSTGNWPFLNHLAIKSCSIDTRGLDYLITAKYKNLMRLNLQNNALDFSTSQILKKANCPRIQFISLASNQIQWFELLFLKSPAWQHLCELNLENTLIGNRGCKMIKQANCALRNLNLDNCDIDAVGLRWLCKANTSRMIYLSLIDNKIGYRQCSYLTKAHFPCLLLFRYHISESGRLLRKAEEITPRGYTSLLSWECKSTEEIQGSQNLLETLTHYKQ